MEKEDGYQDSSSTDSLMRRLSKPQLLSLLQTYRRSFGDAPFSTITNNQVSNQIVNQNDQNKTKIMIADQDDLSEAKKKKKGTPRPFVFSKYSQRYIALQVAYIGFDHAGLAFQKAGDDSIEAHLFSALLQVKLIAPESNLPPESYARSGRTDKTVSALGNTFSVLVRCSAPLDSNQPILYQDTNQETLNYLNLINNALPPTIKAVRWGRARQGFSARHHTISREYRYFFNLSSYQGLNITKMQSAVRHFVGLHDWRNFCKLDVLAVDSWEREIFDASVDQVSPDNTDAYMLRIKGKGFLWHQIRCIMRILLLIGKGLEEESIITDLLSKEELAKGKPDYGMEDGIGLVLWDCEYSEDDVKWENTPNKRDWRGLKAMESEAKIRAQVVEQIRIAIENKWGGDQWGEADRKEEETSWVKLNKRKRHLNLDEKKERVKKSSKKAKKLQDKEKRKEEYLNKERSAALATELNKEK